MINIKRYNDSLTRLPTMLCVDGIWHAIHTINAHMPSGGVDKMNRAGWIGVYVADEHDRPVRCISVPADWFLDKRKRAIITSGHRLRVA